MLKKLLGLENNRGSKNILAALFAYYFGRINQRQFIEYVGDQAEGRRIKDLARCNGYILVNCKLYAYAVHCARVRGEAIPSAASYKVEAADGLILRKLNLSHLDVDKYKMFTLKEYMATVAHMLESPEIKNNIGKFVSKKMSFLLKSFGENRQDIYAYLQEQAMLGVYIQYPRYESYLHFVNIAKATIHNKGQSFISACTSKSRQRLMRNDDGSFETTHIAIDTMAHKDTLALVEAPPNYGAELKERLQALATLEHKLPEKTKAFLLAAAGQHNDGFSAYLKVASNYDLAESMDYEKYMAKLRAYFNVSEANMEKLFINLRNHIHRCNHGDSAGATS